MSDLILSWLNDEVQLSRRVTNFEEDFHNGYLFGELLSKYNQELNFHLFRDKDRRNEKINNFVLLEPTFKTLNIEFNAEIADAILKKRKGEALRTLYRLKMALEKVHNPADIKVFDETGKLNTIVPLKQIRAPRVKFDTMETNLFIKRLNQLNKAQKEVDLDTHLAKFEETRIINEMKANHKAFEESDKDRQIQEERRKIELNKLQRNITFMEDWQAKGRIEWEKNQQKKQERERKDQEFKMMTMRKTQLKALNAEKREREEVLQGIEAFEANAGKLGIELEHDPDQPKKVERSTFSAANTLIKLKDSNLKSEHARKERDKRRRKMIVDQAKAQRDIEIKKREEILLEKLQQQSKQENEIAYEVWRALQCKKVIIENRSLRLDKYKGKKIEQVVIGQAKEDNLLRQIGEEKDRDFDQKMFRQRELNIHQLSEKRLVDHKTCSKFFDYIFEIADLCYQHQQDNDTLEIDPRFWRDCCNLFVEEKPLVPKKSFRHYDATENIVQPPTNELTISTNQLSMAELQDYLNGLGAWRPQHKFDPPKDEEDNQYIPNEPINNFKLGQIVANLIDAKYPQRAPLVSPADIPNYLPFRLLCLGYQFSGRKTLCNFLRKKYNINILDMNEILKEALDLSNNVIEEENNQRQEIEENEEDREFRDDQEELEEALEKEERLTARREIEGLAHIGVEIKKHLAQGDPIPDNLYIQAILFKIKQLFPALTHDQFLDNLRRLKDKTEAHMPESHLHTESNDESEAPHDPPERVSVYQQIHYTEGWILIGFPNNHQQLKALEQALSGFIPDDEQQTSEAEERKKRAEIVVRAPPKAVLPKKLVQGGVDTAIVLDVTKEECLRRALGRRLDPKTGVIYHLEDNPPPINDAPLIERLIPINDPENSETVLIDKLTRYDRIKDDMEAWASVFGIEDIQLNCLQKFDGFGEEADIHAQVQAHLEKVLAFKASQYQKLFDDIELTEKKQQEEQELQQKQELEDAKMVIIDQQAMTQEIEKLQEKRIAQLAIPSELLNEMNSFWEVLQENYINATTGVFTVIKEQRNFITVRIGELQRRFLDLLQKEDDRVLTVLEFQKNYNKFIEENADMIEDADTKEELHQRVEDLYQQLWEMLENKKDELTEERKSIMASGYIEDEMELLTANIQKLIQAELDRYFGCVQIIQDYYCTLEGKDLPEPPENIILDILPKAEITLPPIEDPEGPEPYPRIDLFYKNALKILNGEELEEPNAKDAKKPGTKAPAKKEEPKKAAAGKKGQEVPQEEEKKELTPLEKEMKEAIATEKAILRYRLFVIKSLGTGRIKEMREKARGLYNKLEDWLTYGIKAENDALFELTRLLGEAIEGQTKVQNELQLSYVDVVTSHKHLNFLTPPPVLLPPMEVKRPNRFTISQLRSVIQQLIALTQPTGIIDDTALLQFFGQRTTNAFGKDEFPEEWRSRDFKAYQRLIKNLDPDAKGYVQFKVLASSLCLLSTQLPKEEDVLEYQTELANNSENGMITRENFIYSNAFFDMFEASEQTEANSEHFDRVQLLKDILFSINKEDERDLMDVNEFIRNITAINNSYIKGDKNEVLNTQSDSPARSPGGRNASRSPGRGSRKGKKRVVKTYTNVLFD